MPDGETVTITLDGAVQSATVAGGAFSASFNTAALGVASSPYSITYSYAGDAASGAVSDTSNTLLVSKATPTVVSVDPVNITYGEALANGQLSGTAQWTVGGATVSVSGTFTYTSASGTVLNAGSGQAEAVTFSATDSSDYNSAAATVTVTVYKAVPAVVSVNPVNITFGTALADSQLGGTVQWTVNGVTVNVPGTFAYTSAAGAVLKAGSGQAEAVTFIPADSNDYNSAVATVPVNVDKAVPAVVSVNPVNITYGTALADGQLRGTVQWTVNGTTVSVPGTFSYTSAAGTVLNVGGGQAEAVTFVPTDSTDYNSAAATVIVNVAQATPAFNSLSGPAIVYGAQATTLWGAISLVPDGETVTITLDGAVQSATVAGGAFSASFNTAALGVASSPYSITYSYAGDAASAR